MSRSVLAFGVLLIATFAIAATKPTNLGKFQSASTEASSAGVLPVKRVVLYKNGVGYFEHTADQNRIRENMKALKGSSEERSLLQRYTKQLDSQEDRIATLRGEMDGLRKQHDTAQAELGLVIMDVNLEESF